MASAYLVILITDCRSKLKEIVFNLFFIKVNQYYKIVLLHDI